MKDYTEIDKMSKEIDDILEYCKKVLEECNYSSKVTGAFDQKKK